MASKGALKQIRENIDKSDNEGALKLIQDQLNNNVVDYTLLLFAGFTNKNLRRLDESAEFYRKAIDIAPEQLSAWQGLFEVITDHEWTNSTDDFSLSVVNKLIEKISNSEKLLIYRKARAYFLLELERYEALLSSQDFNVYFDGNKEACLKGLRMVHTSLKKAGAEQLARELLSRINLDDVSDVENHLIMCSLHMKLSAYEDYSKWIISHIRQFSDVNSRVILLQSFGILAHELLRSSLSLAPKLRELSSLCSRLPSSQPHFNQKVSKLFSSANLNAAFDFIIACQTENYQQWPSLGLVLFTFRELGQFCRISKLLRSVSISSAIPQIDQLVVWSLKIESDFQVAETLSEFESILEELTVSSEAEYKCKQLWGWKLKEIYTKCLICTSKLSTLLELENFLSGLFEGDNEQSVLHLKSYFHLNISKQMDTARDLVKKAIVLAEEDPDTVNTDCRDVLLYVRILMAKGQRQIANSQLVGAAQKNAYNSEVFHLLALNLLASGTDLEKAKACAQRALLFNPSSEGTAKLLQELYAKQNIDNKIRLNSLLSFLEEKPGSEWGLKQAALLEINLGKLDQAVEKIQRLVRIKKNTSGVIQDKEMSALWIFLSEAYKQKGNLQSAVRACKTALENEQMQHSATLQLIQLHQGMGHYEEAIELGTSLLFCPSLSSHLHAFAQLIHTHSLVLYLLEAERTVAEQREHLPHIFELFIKLWDGFSNCILLQKMVAQIMNVLLRFSEATLAKCIEQLPQLPMLIKCRVDVYKCSIRCLSRILQARTCCSDVWNDLSVAFLGLYQHQPEEVKLLIKCKECLKNAIMLTTSNQKRSEYWCNMGKVYLEEKDYGKAQHCFIRAIQLNRQSDAGWCLLALMYIKLELLGQSLQAMNQAQKINPQLMEAWCAHAMHAEKMLEQEAMDLYRHTIVLRPTALSIQKYCFLLVQSIHNKLFLDVGTMINFEAIKDLIHTIDLNDHFLHCIALLAEHFWYLEEAKTYISAIKDKTMIGFKENSNRIYIKTSDAAITERLPQSLKLLKKLYGASLDELFAHLMKCLPIANMLNAISSNNLQLFLSAYKSTYYPLLVSTMITFKLSINQELFSAVENIRPLHKLMDVYPTGFNRANADVLLYQQQNEEEKVLVRHDYLSDNLYKLLKQKSKEADPGNIDPYLFKLT